MLRALAFGNLLKTLAAAWVGLTGGLLSVERTFGPSTRVWSWDLDVARVQRDEGTTFDRATILAVIHVESDGRPDAHRAGSQYYGLTQVGADVARSTKTNRAFMVEAGRAGGRESIRAFVRWAATYEYLHDRDPVLMAIGWKGGVGTLKEYRGRLARGEHPPAVRRWLDRDRWGTWTYARMFWAAYTIWSAPDPLSVDPITVR